MMLWFQGLQWQRLGGREESKLSWGKEAEGIMGVRESQQEGAHDSGQLGVG